MARAVAVTISFLFFLFVNVAASLSAATTGRHPLAGTVAFFQLVINVGFIALLLVMGFQVVRRLARQMTRIEGTTQTLPESYPFVDAPFNPNSPGWRIVDTNPMSPISDQQLRAAQVFNSSSDGQGSHQAQ
jgi:hypothetical protein